MWRLLKGLLIATVLSFLACDSGEIVTAVEPLVELHAKYITSRPVVDGFSNETFWQKTPSYIIHVYERSNDGSVIEAETGFNVTIKAVWWKDWMATGSGDWVERPFFAMLINWPDDAKNIEKNVWHYDAQDSNWTYSDSGSDWLLFTWGSFTDYTDLWYWDAALTNPLGYAEDQYVENVEVDSNNFVELFNIDGANILNDYGDFQNTWDKNYNDNLTPRDSTDDYPKMAWKFNIDSIAPFLPRVYSSEDEKNNFLFAHDADLIENTPYLNVDSAISIPGYILQDPIGPSSDIVTAGRYENGYWTVELVRPAATTDDANLDIGFEPTIRYIDYYFNILIGNNAKSPYEAGSKYFRGRYYTSFTFEFVL